MYAKNLKYRIHISTSALPHPTKAWSTALLLLVIKYINKKLYYINYNFGSTYNNGQETLLKNNPDSGEEPVKIVYKKLFQRY